MRLVYKQLQLYAVLFLCFGCGRTTLNNPVNNDIPLSHDGKVGLGWDANYESNLIGCNIYRAITSPVNFKWIAFTNNNYFTNDPLYYNSTYFYKISAINNSNIESQLTNYVFAQPKKLYKPFALAQLTAKAHNWDNSPVLKLNWNPSIKSGIKVCMLYRGHHPSINADTIHYLYFTSNIFYNDTNQIKHLTNYYYKIKAVDKRGLKNLESDDAVDLVLDSPVLIYPEINSIVSSITEFGFVTSSRPADYKLVILSRELYGTVAEYGFSSEESSREIKAVVPGLQLTPFKTYTWRVYTFTQNNIDPKSYSDYFTFTYFLSC